MIYPFQKQLVRDLAWACFSPPLLHVAQLTESSADITDCVPTLTPQRQLWLEQLDRDTSALIEHLAQRPSNRLGIYFEQLWYFFLQQDPEVELLACNLPVHDEGITLGEFDCLYYCHRRQAAVHLELAVKYFLGLPYPDQNTSHSTACDWLGPDARDRLDLKLDHLLQRQTQLSRHPVAKKQLRALGIQTPLKEIGFRGYLFQSLGEPTPPPSGYNIACPMNKWMPLDQVQEYLLTKTNSSYTVLPKMLWLSPTHNTPAEESLSAPALMALLSRHFDQSNYPVLITTLDTQGTEISRFFVTAHNWPESNR